MSYGLEVKNNSNKFQISQSRTNYCLAYSGSVFLQAATTNPYTGGIFPTGSGAIPIADSQDLVFVQGLKLAKGFRGTSSVSVKSFHTASQTVSYRVYRNANVLSKSTSGYGLEVYSESNELQFSSNNPPLNILRVADTFNGSGVSGPEPAFGLLENTGVFEVSPQLGQTLGEITYLLITATSSGYSATTEYTDNDSNESWASNATKTLIFAKE